MERAELIAEIKKVLSETDRTGFGIGDYVKYFNKMRNLLAIALEMLGGGEE
jgi:uncharacterized short protein YbdD (DUF466 family)